MPNFHGRTAANREAAKIGVRWVGVRRSQGGVRILIVADDRRIYETLKLYKSAGPTAFWAADLLKMGWTDPADWRRLEGADLEAALEAFHVLT